MKQVIICVMIICSVFSHSYAQREVTKYFPFSAGDTTTEYDLQIDAGDPKVVAKFTPVFQKYNLTYNISTWDDILQQMLKQINDSVTNSVITLVEGNVLKIGTENKIHRELFLQKMSTIFSSSRNLEKYLKDDDAAAPPIPVKKKRDRKDDDD